MTDYEVENEPVRIALVDGGVGRVIFEGNATTPDDIDALIEVLEVYGVSWSASSGARMMPRPMNTEERDAYRVDHRRKGNAS